LINFYNKQTKGGGCQWEAVSPMLDKSGSPHTSADTGAPRFQNDGQDPVALAREALAEAQASRRDVSEAYIKSGAAFSGVTNNCPQTKAYKLADERVIDARRHLNLVLAGSSSTPTRSKSVNLPINRKESSVPLHAVLKSPRRVGSAGTISVGVTRHCITRTKAKYPLSTMDTLSRTCSLPVIAGQLSESSQGVARRKSPVLTAGDEMLPLQTQSRHKSMPKRFSQSTPEEKKRFSQSMNDLTDSEGRVHTISSKAREDFISFAPSTPQSRGGQAKRSPFL
jgi:hypothetical protein